MKYINEDNLKIPYTQNEMIEQCKLFKKLEFSRISSWSFEQLQKYTEEILKHINQLSNSTEPSNVTKACYYMYIYSKLSEDKLGVFVQILIKFLESSSTSSQKPCNNLAAYVAAHLINKNTSSSIIQRLLTKCIQNISNNISFAFFLYYFMNHSPKVILINSILFKDALIAGLFSPIVNVQNQSLLTLKSYIQEISNKPDSNKDPLIKDIIAEANQKIIQHSSSSADRTCSLSIICTFLEANVITEDILNLEKTFYVLSIQNTDLSSLYLRCLVFLTRYLNAEFKTSTLNILISSFTNKEFKKKPIQNFMKYFELHPQETKSTSKISKYAQQLLGSALSGTDPDPEAFNLLNIYLSQNNNEQSQLLNIGSLLSSAKITEKYVEVVPQILNNYPQIWTTRFETTFTNRVTAELQKTPNPLVIKLLSELNDQKNPKIRILVPSALIQQTQALPPKEFHAILTQLLTSCLSESDSNVRRSIIKSFPECFIKNLTSEQDIRCLALLANDECLKVRKAVIELLSHAAIYTPFRIYPIIRRVLLDVIFLLNAPLSHKLRCEMTKLLLVVVHAGKEILPLYSPLIVQLAIDYLSASPSREITILERHSFVSMSINLIKVLDVIAKSNYSLISSHALNLIDIFIKILGQNNPKNLKLSTFTTLSTFLEKQEDLTENDRKKLFHELMEISSKWSSKTLNIASLKAIGLIGAVHEPVSSFKPTLDSKSNKLKSTSITKSNHLKNNYKNSSNSNNYNNSGNSNNSSNSDEINTICNICLQVLEDDSLSSISTHFEASKIIVTIFCYFQNVSHSFFKRFMTLFFKQIR